MNHLNEQTIIKEFFKVQDHLRKLVTDLPTINPLNY